MRQLTILALMVVLFGCQSKYPGVPDSYHSLLDSALKRSGENAEELKKALNDSPKDQREGMAYLISYMPERDLTTLKSGFLLENLEYAYKARNKYSWCKSLPDSIFFNEVLPYANITENRDPWRKDFYERFAKYVEKEKDIVGALMSVARNIKEEVKVEYNTKRSKVDSSPKEAMAENMATCTGLSILLTDAYRSVGIPSRLAGTAMWTNYKGNHTWSEVWVDNKWQFIEYYPDTLNQSWFLADAGKADAKNMIHWIYAVSYKPTDLYYCAGSGVQHMMENSDLSGFPEHMRKRYEKYYKSDKKKKVSKPYIWGVNETQKYIDLYRESLKNVKLKDDELIVNLVVFKDKNSQTSESRLSCRVDAYKGEKRVNFGYSPRKTDDMNQFLKFKFKKATEYKLVINNPETAKNKEIIIKTEKDNVQDIKLFLN